MRVGGQRELCQCTDAELGWPGLAWAGLWAGAAWCAPGGSSRSGSPAWRWQSRRCSVSAWTSLVASPCSCSLSASSSVSLRGGGQAGGRTGRGPGRPADRNRCGLPGSGARASGGRQHAHGSRKKKTHPTAGSPSTISPTSTETSLAASAAAATPLEQRSGAAGWPAGRQSGHPRLRAATSDPLSWWKAAAAASCDRGAALAACRGAATPRPSVERASRRTPQASSVILKRPKGSSGHLKAAHGVLLLFSRLGELLLLLLFFRLRQSDGHLYHCARRTRGSGRRSRDVCRGSGYGLCYSRARSYGAGSVFLPQRGVRVPGPPRVDRRPPRGAVERQRVAAGGGRARRLARRGLRSPAARRQDGCAARAAAGGRQGPASGRPRAPSGQRHLLLTLRRVRLRAGELFAECPVPTDAPLVTVSRLPGSGGQW